MHTHVQRHLKSVFLCVIERKNKFITADAQNTCDVSPQKKSPCLCRCMWSVNMCVCLYTRIRIRRCICTYTSDMDITPRQWDTQGGGSSIQRAAPVFRVLLEAPGPARSRATHRNTCILHGVRFCVLHQQRFVSFLSFPYQWCSRHEKDRGSTNANTRSSSTKMKVCRDTQTHKVGTYAS